MMSGGISLDPDAQAFLSAAGITNATITTAIDTLVIQLKAIGVWNKMKALYPFVGGTATTHKFNLKNPIDSNAAFRLLFSGGWTHSANGALPNGTNAYADTFFSPNTSLTISSAHFSKYNRNNDLTGIKVDGSSEVPSSQTFFQQNYTGANACIGDVASLAIYIPSDTRGLIAITRTASNAVKVFRNGIQIASNTSTITQIPTRTVFIGGRNDGGLMFPNSYEAAFASIGDGLTDTESANYYTAVQAFQTTLSRQV
jgi:hypothetical protein